MKNKVVVIGSYIVAQVMDTERIPSKGETLMASNFRTTHGGKGSNQAIQASRLGSEVYFVTKIGRDASGEEFVKLCRSENIACDYIYTDPTQPTATGFIICSATGHNIITIDIAALNNFTKAEIDKAIGCVNTGDVVLLQLEVPLEISYYAATQAKQKGAVVILNPAPAMDLRGYDLSMIDYLTPNETEARICAGLEADSTESEAEVAKHLLDMGCKNVIVTLGENGSLYCNGKETRVFEPFKLEQTVDSTGAGDSFNATLATALSEGMGIYEGIKLANAAAALACTKHDTIPSYGTRKEVIEFIEKY